MRLFYPGQAVIPLAIIFASALFMMTRFDTIQIAQYWRLWPVSLIAAGLEELYLWASRNQR
jgi:hypothetical protein